MDNYNIDFLEEKLGKFNKEFEFPRISLYEGSLIYVEEESRDALDITLEKINLNPDLNPTYIWGYVTSNNTIYFTRTYGENKIFVYNPERMKKSEYIKGKLNILKNLDIENIEKMFDQKAVFDYFYKQLWDLRINLAKQIRKENELQDNVSLSEAQYIIDRIIFIYFICEKKLIKIDDELPLSGKELFSEIIVKSDDPWTILKQLFFEYLAKDHDDYLICNDINLKIPYLNGGLFRPKEILDGTEEHLNINFKWNEIFDILNNYTWIINDELPEDIGENYIGNLTPEILGHIYEKFVITLEEIEGISLDNLSTSKKDLKKGNKKIGAYYTPENITEYITENAIYSYLFNENVTTEIPSIEKLSEKELKNLLEKIENITLCDPSCGSGAFILKSGEILYKLQTKIHTLLNQKFDVYSIKKNIIVNNLFGVDIKEGAVEICKLRLWLWLITSQNNENNIETLPNIEYNFMKGNSLFGWANTKNDHTFLINNTDIFNFLKYLKIGLDKNQQKIIDEVQELLKTKKISQYAKAVSQLKKIYYYSSGDTAILLKDAIEEINSQINSQITVIYKNEYKLEYNPIEVFHWKSEFYDVLKNGGFDIIVGNPPYGNILSKEEGEFANKVYSVKKNDIAALFVERSISLLDKKGYLGYIITSGITYNTKFSKIRELIEKSFSECHMLNFDRDNCRFFEGVTLSVTILKCFNKGTELNANMYSSDYFRTTPDNFYNITCQKINEYNIGKKGLNLPFDSKHRIAKIGNETSFNILNKLLINKKYFKDIRSSNNNLFYRISGNYWYNVWNKKPYSSTQIKELGVSNEYKYFVLNIINSSIFYLWMRTYGDGRHLNTDILDYFPIIKFDNHINSLFERISTNLMKYMFENFDVEHAQFMTSNVKPVIDVVDVLMGKLYGLTNDEINHVLNFESEIHGGKKVSDKIFKIIDYLVWLIKNNYYNSEEFNKLINILDKQITVEYEKNAQYNDSINKVTYDINLSKINEFINSNNE